MVRKGLMSDEHGEEDSGGVCARLRRQWQRDCGGAGVDSVGV